MVTWIPIAERRPDFEHINVLLWCDELGVAFVGWPVMSHYVDGRAPEFSHFETPHGDGLELRFVAWAEFNEPTPEELLEMC